MEELNNDDYSEIYVWGSDRFGQLGIAKKQAGRCYFSPKLWDFQLNVIEISCGEEHSAFIVNPGLVFTLGSNADGRLGIGNKSTKLSPKPCQVTFPINSLKASTLSCGWGHTVVVMENGNVYSWGVSEFGALGIKSKEIQWSPVKVELFDVEKYKGKSVSCGTRHTAIVDYEGQLFTCGSSDAGQLGTGNRIQESLPILITGIPEKISMAACGVFHTITLTASGKVYSMGANISGQLGNGTKRSCASPIKIEKLENHKIIKIAAGNHSSAINEEGEVFIWGTGVFGEYLFPTKLNCFSAPISDMKVGNGFGIAIDINGIVYAWGSNSNGELGLGDYEPRITPTKIQVLQGKKVKSASCGGSFVFALIDKHNSNLSNLNRPEETFQANQISFRPFETKSSLTGSNNLEIKYPIQVPSKNNSPQTIIKSDQAIENLNLLSKVQTINSFPPQIGTQITLLNSPLKSGMNNNDITSIDLILKQKHENLEKRLNSIQIEKSPNSIQTPLSNSIIMESSIQEKLKKESEKLIDQNKEDSKLINLLKIRNNELVLENKLKEEKMQLTEKELNYLKEKIQLLSRNESIISQEKEEEIIRFMNRNKEQEILTSELKNELNESKQKILLLSNEIENMSSKFDEIMKEILIVDENSRKQEEEINLLRDENAFLKKESETKIEINEMNRILNNTEKEIESKLADQINLEKKIIEERNNEILEIRQALTHTEFQLREKENEIKKMNQSTTYFKEELYKRDELESSLKEEINSRIEESNFMKIELGKQDEIIKAKETDLANTINQLNNIEISNKLALEEKLLEKEKLESNLKLLNEKTLVLEINYKEEVAKNKELILKLENTENILTECKADLEKEKLENLESLENSRRLINSEKEFLQKHVDDLTKKYQDILSSNSLLESHIDNLNKEILSWKTIVDRLGNENNCLKSEIESLESKNRKLFEEMNLDLSNKAQNYKDKLTNTNILQNLNLNLNSNLNSNKSNSPNRMERLLSTGKRIRDIASKDYYIGSASSAMKRSSQIIEDSQFKFKAINQNQMRERLPENIQNLSQFRNEIASSRPDIDFRPNVVSEMYVKSNIDTINQLKEVYQESFLAGDKLPTRKADIPSYKKNSSIIKSNRKITDTPSKNPLIDKITDSANKLSNILGVGFQSKNMNISSKTNSFISSNINPNPNFNPNFNPSEEKKQDFSQIAQNPQIAQISKNEIISNSNRTKEEEEEFKSESKSKSQNAPLNFNKSSTVISAQMIRSNLDKIKSELNKLQEEKKSGLRSID